VEIAALVRGLAPAAAVAATIVAAIKIAFYEDGINVYIITRTNK